MEKYLKYLDVPKSIFMVNYNDLDSLNNLQIMDEAVITPLLSIKEWVWKHLCKPHPELGRKGHVCPYTLASIRRKHFWFSPYSLRATTPEQIGDVMIKYMKSFLQTEPIHSQEAIFKTFIIVFHKMELSETEQLIDYTHRLLKPLFVENGLMLGQFHANCAVGGAHNPNFMALHAPIPLFVIRNMVINDYLFLQDEQTLLDAYKKHCSEKYPSEFAAYIHQHNLKLDK